MQYLLSLYLTCKIVTITGITIQLSIFLLFHCLKLYKPTRHSLQYSHSVHMICFGKSVISFSWNSTGPFVRMDRTRGRHVSGRKRPLRSCRVTLTLTIIGNKDGEGYNRRCKPWSGEGCLVPTAGAAGTCSPINDDEAEAHYHKQEANACKAGGLEEGERRDCRRPPTHNPLIHNTHHVSLFVTFIFLSALLCLFTHQL